MKILARNLWFIIDHRFELDYFPYDGYTEKKEAEEIIKTLPKSENYEVLNFDTVEKLVKRFG